MECKNAIGGYNGNPYKCKLTKKMCCFQQFDHRSEGYYLVDMAENCPVPTALNEIDRLQAVIDGMAVGAVDCTTKFRHRYDEEKTKVNRLRERVRVLEGCVTKAYPAVVAMSASHPESEFWTELQKESFILAGGEGD